MDGLSDRLNAHRFLLSLTDVSASTFGDEPGAEPTVGPQ
jgi:hypothetical protein